MRFFVRTQVSGGLCCRYLVGYTFLIVENVCDCFPRARREFLQGAPLDLENTREATKELLGSCGEIEGLLQRLQYRGCLASSAKKKDGWGILFYQKPRECYTMT